jgi:hypothetical protein
MNYCAAVIVSQKSENNVAFFSVLQRQVADLDFLGDARQGIGREPRPGREKNPRRFSTTRV